MAMAAMWFQVEAVASVDNKLLILIGLIAVAMLSQAIATVALAVKSAAAMKRLGETVEELKVRALPLLASATELTASTQAMVRDAAPKVKTITDNLLDASETVRGTAKQWDATLTEVNLRTQRQVARVDGMVTSTLVATSELAETIAEGVRGPAMKVAAMATQAKATVEGLVAKAKSMGAGFLAGKRRAG